MRTSSHGWIRNFMSCQRASLLFHFGLLFISSFPCVICVYKYHDCKGNPDAEGSQFSSNLKTVMDDLLRNTPVSGFKNSTSGQTTDTVYGLLQCMANVSSRQCATCSKEAIDTVEQLCRNYPGGRMWMDRCFLRYDNLNFFSELDGSGLTRPTRPEITSDRPTFKTTLSNFLSNLREKAYESGTKRFALDAASYSSTNKVYGLAECWRDLSLDDCKKCLTTAVEKVNECCSVRQGGEALLGSCTLRFQINPFSEFAESDNGTSNAKSNNKSSNNVPLILGVVGGVTVVFAVCIFGSMRRRSRSAISRRTETLVTRNEDRRAENPESLMLKRERNILFKLETLIEATQDFHDENLLGEGGFGLVYKGTTAEGTEIAVKKLSARSRQGRKEFLNEVKLMANVQHRNLVKLLGCCAEGTERLLVYEYLQNKSLDTFLFDSKKRRELDWQTRYTIIVGIARGLLYLHEDSQVRIIHRDIKANNILLDDKLNPKISDFGLARLFPEEETHVQTRIAGTYGYMAPEYAMKGQLSVKADVYSFGVLILEIVSGRKNSDLNLPHESQSVLEWVRSRGLHLVYLLCSNADVLPWTCEIQAWKLYKRGDLLNMVDPAISETVREDQAFRCIQVGLLCAQAEAAIRPQMSNIILMISTNSVKLPNPARPAYVEKYGKDSHALTSTAATSSFGSPQSHLIRSINDAPVSEVEPR